MTTGLVFRITPKDSDRFGMGDVETIERQEEISFLTCESCSLYEGYCKRMVSPNTPAKRCYSSCDSDRI